MIFMHYMPLAISVVEALRLFCLGEDGLLMLGMPDLAMVCITSLLTYLEGIPSMIDDRLKVMALEEARPLSEEEKQNNLAALQERKARIKQRMPAAFEEVPEGKGNPQVRELTQHAWEESLLRNKEGVEAHEFYDVTNKSRSIKKVKSGLKPVSSSKKED